MSSWFRSSLKATKYNDLLCRVFVGCGDCSHQRNAWSENDFQQKTDGVSLTSSCAGSAAEAAATRQSKNILKSPVIIIFSMCIWNFRSYKPNWLWLPLFFGSSSYFCLRWPSRIFFFSVFLFLFSALIQFVSVTHSGTCRLNFLDQPRRT